MASDALYEPCLPVLEDSALDGEEKTEKLEQLLAKEHSLTGQALEDAVLNVLWRFRDASDPSTASPPIRHTIIRKSSPAPWQLPRPSSGLASPSLSAVVPASSRQSRPGINRARSYGASPFGSPRPSPRLAFASPVPHSPQLESYQFSEPGEAQNDYGDIGSDNVDWLLNDDTRSRPSSSGGTGAGSMYEGSSWNESQQNEMSPYDMLRSVLGDHKSDEDIEAALAANGYDLSLTIMSLMGSQTAFPQEQEYVPQQGGEVLIGKSMTTERPVTSGQTSRGRSPIVCKYFLSGGRCMRADCRFSHDLSGHICKYWMMGNCLAGDSCIFSHDPALLISALNTDGGDVLPQGPSFQVQDYDSFPTLQNTGQYAQNSSSPYQMSSYQYSGSPLGNNYMGSPRRNFEQRSNSTNGLSSSPGSYNSRPISRHRSREASPYIPFEDNEAFPTLGSVAKQNTRKHHGKRGGHGHGTKENNNPNSLADVVRMSPSPASASLRKGLVKNKGSIGSRDMSAAAAAAIPAPQHVPWLETGEKTNQAYLKARQEAFRHAAARNRFLQSAAQAWNRNDARAAKALSLRGQSENDLMRKSHREAARLLYEERNKESSSSKEIYIDLHGLHPEEAVEYLEQILVEHQKSSRPVYAITGTGHHSKGGKDKVGKAVRGWLNEWKYASAEFSVPGDNLGGILGIDPSSFDKRLLEKETTTEPSSESMGAKIRLVKEMPAAI